jgi:hypothetical protein
VDVCKRQGRSTSAHGRAFVGHVGCVARHFHISFVVRERRHRSDTNSRGRTLFIVQKRQALKKRGELTRNYMSLEVAYYRHYVKPDVACQQIGCLRRCASVEFTIRWRRLDAFSTLP